MNMEKLPFEFPAHLNPHLDEWVLEREDWDKAQCISLLEYRHVTNLTKLDTIMQVLHVITGFESSLFKLNRESNRFEPQKGYALAQLNSEPFRRFLQQFANVGTMYLVMDRFCEEEYFRGSVFSAFQIGLKNVLGEILEKVLEVRRHFTHHSKPVNDRTITLIALPCFLNQDRFGNILRSIRNLHATYLTVISEMPATPTSIPAQVERFYTCQVLESLFKRSLLPDSRIRSLAFTLLDHCLNSVFRTLEAHLTTLSSLTSSEQFLFYSKFESDQEFEFTFYTPETIDQFWCDLLAPHDDLKRYTFFRFESLPSLAEAIKCSYALRKNGIRLESHRFELSRRFRENLTECFRIWAHPDETFDLVHNEKVDVYKFEDNILGLPDVKSRRFQCYQLPLRLMYDLGTLIHRAMDQTLNQVSKPLISQFVSEFRINYLHLLHYYTDLYLVQRSDHIVHYLHYFFPQLKTLIALKPRSASSAPVFERLLRLPTDSDSYFSELARVFRPSVFNGNPSRFDELSTHQALFEVFEQFFFLPKFTTDSQQQGELHHFWPLNQLFNPNVTEVFNQLFQMLLKLRYFQYLIGEDFLLSDRFRFGKKNSLNKETYLFRFRLANLIFLFGRQTESHLRKLLVQTEKRLAEATTLAKFLEEHQRFLRRLIWIRDTLNKDRFFSSLLTSTAKFCAPWVGESQRRSRRDSIFKAVQGLDLIYQSDFYSTTTDD